MYMNEIQNMNAGDVSNFTTTKKTARYIAAITGNGRYKGCVKTSVKKQGDDVWQVTVRCFKKVPQPKSGNGFINPWTKMMKNMDNISAFTWKSKSVKVEVQIRRAAGQFNYRARYKKFSVRKVADGIRVSRVNLDPTVEYDVK